MIEEEIWKDIAGTNGYYQISQFGNVRSWYKKATRIAEKSPTPFYMAIKIMNIGYPRVTIRFNDSNTVKGVLVHRLVAMAFIPNPYNLPFVLHKDDNKLNPYYKNLEWGTSTKNNQDAFIRGLIVPAKGVRRNKSSLSEQDVLDIFNSTGFTARGLGRIYNVNHTAICAIKNGKSWNHVTGLLCTRKKRPKFSKDIKFAN